LVGGYYSTLAGQTRNYIARLNNTDMATQVLSYAESTITWSRGGTSPEVWRTTFEHTTNGTSWAFLGAGSRTSGGWELPNVSLIGGTIRARGYAASGHYNGSVGIVESVIEFGAPRVVGQPQSRTNNAGTAGIFTVGVV
jgi:hypothetical protein